MAIDITKITPEKLAEMNDSLIVDNQHLRKQLEEHGVCVEDELATADKFDPKYLSKIVD